MNVSGFKMRRLFVACSVVAMLAGCGESARETSAPEATAPTPTAEAPLTSDAAPPPAAEAETSAGSDVTGPYFPTTPLPPEFAELEHLLLATIDDNGNPAPLNGFLRPKAAQARDYVLVNPTLSGRTLTFTTAPVDGVHYTFAGTFARLANFAADPPPHDEAVLTGTLTKMHDGKSVAATPVSLAYQAGG